MTTTTAAVQRREAARGHGTKPGEFGYQAHSAPAAFEDEPNLTPAELDTDDIEESSDGLLTDGKLERAAHLVELANRRLHRHGIDGEFTLTSAPKLVRDERGFMIQMHEVRLDRPDFHANGWRFDGYHEATAAGAFVSRFNASGDLRAPDGVTCGHCGSNRHRTKMFTVTNADTGEQKQLGSSCLELFLGFTPAGLTALYDDPLEKVGEDDDVGGFGGPTPLHAADDVVLAAIRASDAGADYVSRADAKWMGLPATADRVRETLESGRGDADAATDDEQQLIDDVYAWAAEIPEDAEKEYLRNLRSVFQTAPDGRRYVNAKHVGLAASAIASFRRNQEWAAKKAAREASRARIRQEFVGQPKDKLSPRTMEILGVTEVPGSFGYRPKPNWFIRMIDEDGHLLTWKATNPPVELMDAAPGSKFQMERATVSDHEIYRDDHITRITRAKFAVQGD